MTSLPDWLVERAALDEVPATSRDRIDRADPQEMTRLERASGPRFDELFLLGMIRHHEGAVLMVESLLTEGEGGQESEVFQLAGHIGSDQQVEIAAMKRKLAELAG